MSMANSLKLKVVAESLETPQQLPFFLKYHWPNMADEIWANEIHSFYGTHFKRTDSLHSSMKKAALILLELPYRGLAVLVKGLFLLKFIGFLQSEQLPLLIYTKPNLVTSFL